VAATNMQNRISVLLH